MIRRSSTCCPASRRARIRCGFTLVELLVVIGIIAVLIGILLPALASARRSAGAVKCSASLREVGNCFKMYELDSKGFWPVARINGIMVPGISAAQQYKFEDRVFFGSTQGYWFDFLAKFATKNKVGNAAGGSGITAQDAYKTVFYGCPAFQAYTNTSGTTNVLQPGYGMNPYPTITPSYPKVIQGAYPPFEVKNRPYEYAVMDTANSPTGSFLKAKLWTKPSERMLVTDSRFWITVTGRAPVASNYPPCVVPQPVLLNDTAGTGLGDVFSSSPTQTLVDIYRHGAYPKRNGDNFETSGGKISYNILYADGHVATSVDARDSYRSFRMKFPG